VVSSLDGYGEAVREGESSGIGGEMNGMVCGAASVNDGGMASRRAQRAERRACLLLATILMAAACMWP
jgi:hypothetical protein